MAKPQSLLNFCFGTGYVGKCQAEWRIRSGAEGRKENGTRESRKDHSCVNFYFITVRIRWAGDIVCGTALSPARGTTR